MENDRLISITIKDIDTDKELRGEVLLSKMKKLAYEADINVLNVMFSKINKELDELIKK